MNVMLIMLMITLGIFFIFIAQYLLEKKAIIVIYLIYNIVAFLLSFKTVEMLQISFNANVAISSMIVSLTYFIIEKLPIKEYKNIIKGTFISNLFLVVFVLLSSLYISSVNDVTSLNMQYVFLNNYKILIAYPIVTLITQLLILLIYKVMKDVHENTNVKIILTNLTILKVESSLFYNTGYIFDISFSTLFVLIISNYLIKVVITSIYTPFINFLIKLKKVKS